MALGNAKIGGTPYAPLGRTMIGGLIVSCVLTLLIVPLFYTLLDDMREHIARLFGSALGRGRTDDAVPGVTGAAAGVGRANRVD